MPQQYQLSTDTIPTKLGKQYQLNWDNRDLHYMPKNN